MLQKLCKCYFIKKYRQTFIMSKCQSTIQWLSLQVSFKTAFAKQCCCASATLSVYVSKTMHHHCAHASWIVLISLFLVFLLHFLFVLCVRVSWLSISCLLHVKYSLSHRIRSYVRVNYTGHRIICPRYHQGTSDLQTLWHYNILQLFQLLLLNVLRHVVKMDILKYTGQ